MKSLLWYNYPTFVDYLPTYEEAEARIVSYYDTIDRPLLTGTFDFGDTDAKVDKLNDLGIESYLLNVQQQLDKWKNE